ncbi:thrombospondin [Micromonospora radicis]|uniref:Thrombospondin n=1 Tax=Micromonospora radicis TaxID=1894971 RepID=A0A418MQR9_9ACTN|nr:thrombospondin [Micromonospora radicis]
MDEEADGRAAVATDTRTTDARPTSGARATTDTSPAGGRPVAERGNTRTYRGGAAATATDQPTDRIDADQVATDRPGTGRPAADQAANGRAAADRAAADQVANDRAATARSGVDGSRRARTAAPAAAPNRDRTTAPSGVEPGRGGDPDRVAERELAGDEPAVVRRPRASLLATLGLVVGSAGLLFVLTGTLAGYGIAIGAVGAVLAVLGLIGTRRRHLVGKPDALLGIALGLGAVVLGVLAMTGQYDWPTTDGDAVARLREWLDSQFVNRS